MATVNVARKTTVFVKSISTIHVEMFNSFAREAHQQLRIEGRMTYEESQVVNAASLIDYTQFCL